jgi:uncharacterized protein HemY
VNLLLTSDKDPQLHVLAEYILKGTEGLTGWYRLGKLMIELGQFNKAEELYKVLLDERPTEHDIGFVYYQLG